MARGPQGRAREECQLLLEEWGARCRAGGSPEPSNRADGTFLVSALYEALERRTHTSDLGRAARTWGAHFTAPAEALFCIFQLRDVLSSMAAAGSAEWDVSAATIAWVFDQVIIEVVDAASSNLRSAACIDSLTGCANRRALDEELVHALASSRRSGLDMSLAVLDLDGLKVINDTQGHPAGDAALVGLVQAVRSSLRKADTLYRTGGDEFVVLTPFTDAAGARSLMMRVEQSGGPSFSWGVACTAQQEADPERGAGDADGLEAEAAALLAVADADLYARRRARRREMLRSRRKRRAAVVASVAASASVTSGAVMAAALNDGPPGLSAQRSPFADARPSAGGTAGGTMSNALFLPHGSRANPFPRAAAVSGNARATQSGAQLAPSPQGQGAATHAGISVDSATMPSRTEVTVSVVRSTVPAASVVPLPRGSLAGSSAVPGDGGSSIGEGHGVHGGHDSPSSGGTFGRRRSVHPPADLSPAGSSEQARAAGRPPAMLASGPVTRPDHKVRGS